MLHNYPLFTTYTLIIKREKPLCNNKLLFAIGGQLGNTPISAHWLAKFPEFFQFFRRIVHNSGENLVEFVGVCFARYLFQKVPVK